MKNFWGIFLIVVGFCVSDVVYGSDDYLFSPLFSYHERREDGECEFNPGMGYRVFDNEYRYKYVGVFRNSHCNVAIQGMIGWESDRDDLFGVGIMVGLSSGYGFPIVGAPYIRVGGIDNRINVNIMVLPIPDRSVYGFGVSYKLRD